jgi:hypothetical protein
MESRTIYAYDSDSSSIEERTGLSAQAAGEELDRIRRRDGTIAPAVVVDEARPQDAPLHPAFTWNDPVAAEQWREHEARRLIRHVRVVTPPAEPRPPSRAVIGPRVEQPEEPVETYDPLAHDVSLAVGALTETRRQIEQLRMKAAARFDRAKVISANVALAELDEAEQNLSEAHEALTASRRASCWARDLQGNLIGS